MTKGTVEVVWRGLDAAAVTRLGQQVQRDPDRQTASGYTREDLAGVRVLQLRWSPRSPARRNKALRTAIALALQGDRTLDSVVPAGVPGHVASFPLGGSAIPKVTWKNRINLTLGYDPASPNAEDTAVQIRTRLENTGGLSVKLTPQPADADLALVDRKAWTTTALAWLQPYLDAPLAGTADVGERTETEFRGTTEPRPPTSCWPSCSAGGGRPGAAADQPVRRADLRPRRDRDRRTAHSGRAGSSACGESAMADPTAGPAG